MKRQETRDKQSSFTATPHLHSNVSSSSTARITITRCRYVRPPLPSVASPIFDSSSSAIRSSMSRCPSVVPASSYLTPPPPLSRRRRRRRQLWRRAPRPRRNDVCAKESRTGRTVRPAARNDVCAKEPKADEKTEGDGRRHASHSPHQRTNCQTCRPSIVPVPVSSCWSRTFLNFDRA